MLRDSKLEMKIIFISASKLVVDDIFTIKVISSKWNLLLTIVSHCDLRIMKILIAMSEKTLYRTDLFNID